MVPPPKTMEATHWRLPTVRALIALAWPMILGRAAQSVVGFTDAVMVAPREGLREQELIILI